MESKYKDNIIGLMDKQMEKGFDKYGYVLEDNVELNIFERLQHLKEELVDGLFYIEHIEAKLKEKGVK